ncbi:hypothetical protein ACH47Z_28820 [Streptomyces sp. NPDC020192]|uniref:hypothetical protein n=1 Tax=Streptomyces sp. NPDC020192 TaxID=3365066 RepID=UPI003799B697
MGAETTFPASPRELLGLVDSCESLLQCTDPERAIVAAAVLADDGRVFTALHVRSHNCSHCSVCAEAVAIGMAVTAGAVSLVAAVSVVRGNGTFRVWSPCGGCRELLRDHGVVQVIVARTPDGGLATATPNELLPWP